MIFDLRSFKLDYVGLAAFTSDSPRKLIAVAANVVWTPKSVEFPRANLVSFTPGFSQVNCPERRSGNRLNGFWFLLRP
jgi:hypothetical protein